MVVLVIGMLSLKHRTEDLLHVVLSSQIVITTFGCELLYWLSGVN